MGNRNQHSLIPLGNSRPIVFLLPTIMLSTQGPLEAFTPYTNYRGTGLRGTWRAPSIVIEMKRKEKGRLVYILLFYDFISLTSLLLPKWSDDLKYGPCLPTRTRLW